VITDVLPFEFLRSSDLDVFSGGVIVCGVVGVSKGDPMFQYIGLSSRRGENKVISVVGHMVHVTGFVEVNFLYCVVVIWVEVEKKREKIFEQGAKKVSWLGIKTENGFVGLIGVQEESMSEKGEGTNVLFIEMGGWWWYFLLNVLG
jgi:hypothetical protein